MTRIKLELTAVDDWESIKQLHRVLNMMTESFFEKRKLYSGYTTGDTYGSCVCDVIREDNGIERGMEVTP